MHRSSVSESCQRTGAGGREEQLLAVAKKKAQELSRGPNYNLGHQQGAAGRDPCLCSATMRCTGVKAVKHP